MGRWVARVRRGEAGESLLEILISIMIIGIGVTAILSAVGIAAKASTLDERQVTAQAMLRSWGEHIQAVTTDANWTGCATTSTYGPTSTWAYTTPPPTGLEPLPADFTPGVSSVTYWDGSTFASTCGTDSGVQHLTLTLTVADGQYPGFTATYPVVLRRPCAALATATVAGC